MLVNKYERHSIDPNKSQMDTWSKIRSRVKYIQYNNLVTYIHINAPVEKQKKILAKCERNK